MRATRSFQATWGSFTVFSSSPMVTPWSVISTDGHSVQFGHSFTLIGSIALPRLYIKTLGPPLTGRSRIVVLSDGVDGRTRLGGHDRIEAVTHRQTSTAAIAPASCARMNSKTLFGPIPANVFVSDRASVTAGFANDVDEVNQGQRALRRDAVRLA